MKRTARLKSGKPLARGQPLKRGTKPMKRGARLRAKGGRLFKHVVIDRPYLDSLRGRPCAFTAFAGAGVCYGPMDPHHVIPKSQGGGDETAVPACRRHHNRWHHDAAFREATTPTLLAWAAELWAASGRETGAP